ncbi:ankyrin repeat protein [Cooperia oncophora]
MFRANSSSNTKSYRITPKIPSAFPQCVAIRSTDTYISFFGSIFIANNSIPFSKNTCRTSRKSSSRLLKPKTARKLSSLIESGVDINCHDAGGMSPLAAAAYRGLSDVVELCIKKGANVNDKEHKQSYTPLMFAALAGQHECVSIINNHVSIDEIEKFLCPQVASAPTETYPENLSRFIHRMCSWHQVHPVAITLELGGYEDAVKYQKKILYVVDRVFERQLRCKEGNEVRFIFSFIQHDYYLFTPN